MRVLPHPSGPTQVRTTPELSFRAVIKAGGDVDLGVALWPGIW
jgi:hypothetical protein